MKVKVSNVTRWKNQDVPRLEFDHQSQLIKNNLTIFPVSKWNDNTKKFVNPVTMGISGDTEVDDNSSKGVADWKITKAETSAVGLNLLVFPRHVLQHLYVIVVSFVVEIQGIELTLALTNFITSSIIPERITYSSKSFWISAEGLGMR
jgi:hypothetical protein